MLYSLFEQLKQLSASKWVNSSTYTDQWYRELTFNSQVSLDVSCVLPFAVSLDVKFLWPRLIVMFTESKSVIQQGVLYQCAEQLLQQEKKTGVSLQATLQSTSVAFEVIAYQYLGATDRQQSHLCIISLFSTSTSWANRRRRKDRNTKQNMLSRFFVTHNLPTLVKCLWNSAVRLDSNNVLFSRR